MPGKNKAPDALLKKIGAENLHRLAQLFAEGKGFSEIAGDMPKIFVSRNAVAGMRRDYRDEITRAIAAYVKEMKGTVPRTGHSKPFGIKKTKVMVPSIPRQHVQTPVKLAQPKVQAVPRPLKPAVLETERFPPALPISGESCRWPEGDPSTDNFHFCGKNVMKRGSPYCEAHARKAHQPQQSRRNSE